MIMHKYSPSQSSVSSISASTSSASFHSRQNIHLEPDISCYNIITSIGQTFCKSKIYLAKHEKSDKLVAIKCVNLDSSDKDNRLFLYTMEIYMASMLNHANIARHLTSFIHSSQLWLIMDYVDKGSVRDILDTIYCDGMPEASISCIIRQVTKALSYLHSRNIIHRSVKTSHILIDHTGHVLLSGLKYATNMVRDGRPVKFINDFCGTDMSANLYWLSPELLAQHVNGYGLKSDIYSLGIVACELANGLVPFCEMEPTKMFKEKLEGTVPKLIDKSTCPPLMSNGSDCPNITSGPNTYLQERVFSKHFHNFVGKCLSLAEDERPSAEEVLAHSFTKESKHNSESLQSNLQSVSLINQNPSLKGRTLWKTETSDAIGNSKKQIIWDFSV